jgi:hypothetical protein
MAVAYLDARAVQKRLDEAVGPFNWKNVYSLWHDNSQICGISIFNAERNEWVTKFDGAENTDIEPIKGGLSDSFKRAACIWGIGRYLYELGGIWVEVETKGKSCTIKQNQYSKLESEYNAAVNRIFGLIAKQKSHSAVTSDKSIPVPSVSANNTIENSKLPEAPAFDYKVHSIQPSGKSSQVLELIDGNGGITKAYIKTADQAIALGSRLREVKMERKSSDYGEYNIINAYKFAA